MDVSGQRHAPVALYAWELTPGAHCTEGWVGLRAGLDTEARGKILYLCRGPVCVVYGVRLQSLSAAYMNIIALTIEVGGNSETSVQFYETKWHNITEYGQFHCL
jgi:hypothetical protein